MLITSPSPESNLKRYSSPAPPTDGQSYGQLNGQEKGNSSEQQQNGQLNVFRAAQPIGQSDRNTIIQSVGHGPPQNGQLSCGQVVPQANGQSLPGKKPHSAVARVAQPFGPGVYGTGKRATTILADQGDYVHVISDVPFKERIGRGGAGVSASVLGVAGGDVGGVSLPGSGRRGKRGVRPMHTSTLGIKTQPISEYQTTLQTYHGGNPCKPPPGNPPPYPSQHTSQVKFGVDREKYWHTYYDYQFYDKGTDQASKLHYPSQLNKLNMNEGGDMKVVLDTSSRNEFKYWSQYNRVHNKLGAILGPGVPRERVVRTAYNPITGEGKGSAWKENNRRISGNRILFHGHRPESTFILD